MKPNRDLILVLLLFAVLIGFTAVLGARQLQDTERQGTPYASYTTQNDGTLGLHNWLQALGYRVRREEASPLKLNSSGGILLMLPAQEDTTQEEARRVLAWVEQGGTLILAVDDRITNRGNRDTSAALIQLLDVSVSQGDFANRATWQQPLLSDLREPIYVETRGVLEPAIEQVSFLTPEEGNATDSVLIQFKRGLGTVFVTTAPYIFTNASLSREANAALVRGLFRGTQPGDAPEIIFDESHRALFDDEGQTNWVSLLYNTAWGQGMLFALLLSFVYLVMGGKRFGRPLPLPTEVWRRNPAEYALSMAGLYQRAGKHRMALQHYRHQLKRRLAKPVGLNADLPDAEFVEALSRAESSQTFDANDANALLNTLRQLDAATDAISESQFVSLAQAATEFSLKAQN